MNAIFNAVSMEEFKRISNVKVAYIAWNILQSVHEGTKAIKINKLQQLTTRFESIRMSDDGYFDEFYAKLNDIVNHVLPFLLFFRWWRVLKAMRILSVIRQSDMNALCVSDTNFGRIFLR